MMDLIAKTMMLLLYYILWIFVELVAYYVMIALFVDTILEKRSQRLRAVVKQGDVTTTSCDGIINPTNHFNFSGPVSQAILSKGGPTIAKQCSNNPLITNNLKVTTGGNLCKHIMHISVSQDVFSVENTLFECFIEADRLGLSELATPAIGTGGMGLTSKQSAVCLASAIKKFNNTNCVNLRTLEVYVYQPEMLQDFQQELEMVAFTKSKKSALPSAPNQAHKSTANKVRLVVKQGDITSTTCDGIVNSTKNFDLSGLVSKAIVAKGGKTITVECASSPIKSTDNMRITTGGSLCKNILHIAISDNVVSLENAVLECFNEADSLGLKHLAVPAVGTGGLGISTKDAAKSLASAYKRFRKRNPANLQMIEVCIFQKSMLSVFKDELKDCDTPSELSQVAICNTANSLRVVIKQGDITTTSCDGIVNATNNFNMSGPVSKSLIAKGGNAIIQEMAENPDITNNLKVTSGGKLCKHILHVSISKDLSRLVKILVRCFSKADGLGLKTLAMPAVGTGGMGISCKLAAKCIASAIDIFDKTKPSNVQSIEVDVYQSKMLQDFQQELSILDRDPSKHAPGLMPLTQSTKEEIDLKVVVKQGDITSTNCDGIVSSTDEKFNLTGATAKSLISKCGDAIVTECDKNPVSKTAKMRVTKGGSFFSYIFNVAIPKDLIGLEKILIECFTEADSLAVEKLAVPAVGTGGMGVSSIDAAKCLSSAIEKFSKMDSTNLRKIVVYVYQKHMLPDFQSQLSHMVCGVSRTNRTYIDSFFLEKMGMEETKKVKLGKKSLEYTTVISRFKSTLNLQAVVKLERIQNPTLWKQFIVQKQKVQNHIGSKNVSRQLFHGSSGDACEQIWKQGFDRSFTGEKVLYGRGAYFATTASYSNKKRYAIPDNNGNKHMFLVEVITGNFCKGDETTKTRPMQSDGWPFDSVVNDTVKPDIFVIFSDVSAYPMYLLTYKAGQ